MKTFGKILITGAAAAVMSVSVYANEVSDSYARIFVNGNEVTDA